MTAQRVRPQNRPPQPDGGVRDLDWPVWRMKPVAERGGDPAFERIPGQTGYWHWFTSVNVLAVTPVKRRWYGMEKRRNRMNLAMESSVLCVADLATVQFRDWCCII